MGIDPGRQGLEALLCLFCGVALGFVYELLAAVLRRLRLEKWLILFYIPYSLLAGVLLFLLGSIAGRGQLRLFMLLGLVLGGLTYLTALRPPGRWLAGLLCAGAACIAHLLLAPFRLLHSLLKKLSKKVKKLFLFTKKWFRIKDEQMAPVLDGAALEANHETSEYRILYHCEPSPRDASRLCAGVPLQDERPHRRSRGGSGCSGR